MDTKQAGLRLKHVRKDILGISSTYTLAEELNVSQSLLAANEVGKLEIGINTLAYLYQKYGILPHYITTGEGAPIDHNKSKTKPSEMMSIMQSEIIALKAMVEGLTKDISKLKKELPK